MFEMMDSGIDDLSAPCDNPHKGNMAGQSHYSAFEGLEYSEQLLSVGVAASAKAGLLHGTEPWTDSLKEVLTVASDPMSVTSRSCIARCQLALVRTHAH